MIEKIIIHNYKKFSDFELDLDNDLNIIVGDNETGKSTILEAINLALTKRLNGRLIESELSPYLFHNESTNNFLKELKSNKKPDLPTLFIELYFNDNSSLASFRGRNNSLHEDRIGIRLEIIFNEEYKSEYEELIKDPAKVNLLPTEYYKVNWHGFDGNPRTQRGIPIKISFIDATIIRLQSGSDYYLQSIINDGLEIKEKTELSIVYRQLKEGFADHKSIETINKSLHSHSGAITDKQLTIGLDVSQKSNWETSLVPHLDNLPSQYSGKGEQNSLKIMLALRKNANDANVILIEEPENHLSFSSMHKLLTKIQERCKDKQIIIATHNSLVLNKLGLEKLILIWNGQKMRLNKLPPETRDYFKKLSGYDTLRLILAKKSVLVEGPSDELIFQKAYLIKYGKLPINDGIDVLSVRGLSFKRFLDIARELRLDVSVITDNDGDYEKNVVKKYQEYMNLPTIKVFFDRNNDAHTLEPQIVKCNNLETLNNIFATSAVDKNELISYMERDKAEWALKLFNTEKTFVIPQYIQNALA